MRCSGTDAISSGNHKLNCQLRIHEHLLSFSHRPQLPARGALLHDGGRSNHMHLPAILHLQHEQYSFFQFSLLVKLPR